MAGTAEELKFQGNTKPCKISVPESPRQEHGRTGVRQAIGPGEEVPLSRGNSVARGWESGSLVTSGSTAELPVTSRTSPKDRKEAHRSRRRRQQRRPITQGVAFTSGSKKSNRRRNMGAGRQAIQFILPEAPASPSMAHGLCTRPALLRHGTRRAIFETEGVRPTTNDPMTTGHEKAQQKGFASRVRYLNTRIYHTDIFFKSIKNLEEA